MTCAAAAALAALEPLQQRQLEALRDGDADALVPLATEMRAPLAALARCIGLGHLPKTLRPRLIALAAQAEAARTAAARRSLDVQRSLDALGQAGGGLQAHQQRGTYGAHGAFAAARFRSGGSERA